MITAEQLVRAKNGNDDDIAELLLACFDDLIHDISPSIPSRLRPHIDVNDVLQDAFTDAWLQVRDCEYRDAAAFYAWLRTIARRRLVDRIRITYTMKRGGSKNIVRIRDRNSSTTQPTDPLVDKGKSPSSFAAQHEAGDAVHRALASLAENHQQVLALRYVEGLTAAEVGARLNSSEHAIHMMTRRALGKLRKKMGNASRFFRNSAGAAQ